MKEKEKLQNLISENPDPSKWSMWLKVIIKALVLILSAALGDSFSINDLIF